jgi:chloramphenicol O-acetyltransferase type A
VWLDLATWPRRAHFEFFRGYESPFFNLVAAVDVTETRAWCKDHGASFFLAGWYAGLGAVNAVEALRMRIRGDGVWVHDRVSVGSTVLAPDETFRFAYLEAADSFPIFAANGRAAVDRALAGGPLDDQAARDDLVYGTVVPWVSFTGLKHARRKASDDSVPRLAFGKFEQREGRWWMPVSIEAHHALADGLHAGRFFEGLTARFADPDRTFSG